MAKVTDSKEYAVLLREHKDLVAEHERLESEPFDQEVHGKHRHRLIDHNKRLHDFIATHFANPMKAERKTAEDKRRGSASKARKPSRSSRHR